MPKQVLHLLYEHDEAIAMQRGEPIHIVTHGIENIVIQVERKRYARQPPVVEIEAQPATVPATRKMPPRTRTLACRNCHKMFTAQGHWKHEAACKPSKKGKTL